MEPAERSRSPSRRTSRVEQVVGRWLRRSRESGSRERILGDGASGDPANADLRSRPIRVMLQVARDPALGSHGFSLSTQMPLLVQEVTAGGPAEGMLVPGDQVLRINDISTEDLSAVQAADILRESRAAVTVTILRHTLGPKSSFITEEKRARLKTNPVKVHFAEEVVVNGHCQGNSLLFLPNVLKVYLENGQTKAFKFDTKTTVKDIVLTLKEKLSILCIEYFTLVLEQQYSVTKLLLLHDDELVEQVVQKREAHDYRCMFRVCFTPRDPLDVLQEDPVAFEYLYLQSVADVLQERFAVEMKCSMALRLAALHVRERLLSCGQTQKASLKSVTKSWGIENLVSPTLLKNMKEKDLLKALSYNLKKSQAQEPRHKVTSVTEARLSYLRELAELKCFGAKSFTATMMLQDRDSTVTLLVGAKYGISQVINHKHSIMTRLSEFGSISRLELLPESDKVSLVKIYLQEIKPITLMLECQAAKDLSCLVAGYCKLLVDPTLTVFPWTEQAKEHRISAEEGYVSRGCSDSEESSELDNFISLVSPHLSTGSAATCVSAGEKQRKRKMGRGGGEEVGAEEEGERGVAESGEAEGQKGDGDTGEEGASEVGDSCCTESRFVSSCSSDSLDALEEDDFITCSSSHPIDLEASYPYSSSPPAQHDPGGGQEAAGCTTDSHLADGCNIADPTLRFAELSRMAQWLPSPPEASEEEECMFTFEEKDARPYYNICCNVTPDSACSLPKPVREHPLEGGQYMPLNPEPLPIFHPPPGFEDSSSEEEFFDARDRLSSPEFTYGREPTTDGKSRMSSLTNVGFAVAEPLMNKEREMVSRLGKKSRKRRSFVASEYTSQVSFPSHDRDSRDEDMACCFDTKPPTENFGLTFSSLTSEEGDSAQLESKPIPVSASWGSYSQEKVSKNKQLSSSLLEMEPDTMEFKSVTELIAAASPVILAVRCRLGPEGKESCKQPEIGDCATNHYDAPFPHHRFLLEKDGEANHCKDSSSISTTVKGRTEENGITTVTGEAQAQKTDPLSHLSKGREILQLSPVSEVPLVQLLCPVPSLHTETSTFHMPIVEDVEESSNDDLDADAHFTAQDHSGSLALAIQTSFSHSFESLLDITTEEAVGSTSSALKETGVIPLEPGAFNLHGCTTGLVSRLSTTTLRGKIQMLPWLLSRSQEAPGHNAAEVEAVGLEGVTGLEYTDGESDDTIVTELVNCIRVSPDHLDDWNSDLCFSKREAPLFHCTETTVPSGDQSPGKVPAQDTDPTPEVTERCDSVGPESYVRSCPQDKDALDCSPASVLGCPSMLEEHQAQVACGCQAIYTNCFNSMLDKNRFDGDLTVYEFSRRTQGMEGAPLIDTPPFSWSAPPPPMDLNPLSAPLEDILNQLRNRRYRTPDGFSSLQQDLVVLLTLLKEAQLDRGHHHQETCALHFSEDKRLLRAEARKLMSLCQRVIRVGQTPEEMLLALAESFRTLVQLASVCLWFSSCGLCQRRHAEVLRSLTDITGTYEEFSQLAERASGRKSCHDIVIKLLARQCTTLTASIFCLTQLFRTLADL
ncbi:FERM and PDZ domain-containing protein 1 isoform X2 [Brienomyrus brachyistius]|uniref:FERM and PDZ domain-containing protein 1 isoform X2 n=1 Tax=Brienomyrus brachyistius TaxID=42636 RepID=UPI0020B359D8|nr:FERM and PDZ domain-containing protein 1 isoform X2 [Brienomyrus brachyistius]